MGNEEKTEKQFTGKVVPEETEEGLYKTGGSPDGAEGRRDGLSLEGAFCVYYEILRSLERQDRLVFFKLASLIDHMILYRELCNEDV